MLSVSQEAILDPAMPAFAQGLLAEAGVAGECLVLGVQESKVFTNLRAVQDFVASMAAMGVRIVLERFGAGLNSLQLLAHIEPALLKIDPPLPRHGGAQRLEAADHHG